MAAIKTANDLFVEELKDIYSAEKQAVRIYPKLAKAITSPALKQVLQAHLEETKGQIERLDQIFEQLGKKATGKTCQGMKGLIEEGSEHAEEIKAGLVRDAALIGAAQRMEHYEIAAYGTVIAFAKATGQTAIAQLLSQTLEEEKAADEKLTGVSDSVNGQAVSDSQSEMDEQGEGDEEDAPGGGKKSAKKSSSKKSAKKSSRK